DNYFFNVETRTRVEPLDRVLGAACHQLALINDIFDISKIEAEPDRCAGFARVSRRRALSRAKTWRSSTAGPTMIRSDCRLWSTVWFAAGSRSSYQPAALRWRVSSRLRPRRFPSFSPPATTRLELVWSRALPDRRVI